MDIDLVSDSCEISDTESPQQINDMLLDNVAIDQSEDKIKQQKKKYSPLPKNKKKLYIKPISDYECAWLTTNSLVIFRDKVDNVYVFVSVSKKKYQFCNKKDKPLSKAMKINFKNKDEADLYKAAKEEYKDYSCMCTCSIY